MHCDAFHCNAKGEDAQIAGRLKQKVQVAARMGFAPLLLSKALPDAQVLLNRWGRFMPSKMNVAAIVSGAEVAAGAHDFAWKLGGGGGSSPSQHSPQYCLYAHVAAVFVVQRFRPLKFAWELLHAKQIAGGMHRRHSNEAGGVNRWVSRALHRHAGMPLPTGLVTDMYLALHRALFLFGYNRVFDQAHLVGWPVASGELVEFAEALRTVCLRPSKRCTLRKLHRDLTLRLRVAWRLATTISREPTERYEIPLKFVQSWPASALRGGLQHSNTETNIVRKKTLTVFMTGTHGALFKEVEASWRSAVCGASSNIHAINFQQLSHSAAYFGANTNIHATNFVPPNSDDLIAKSRYAIISHTYVMPHTALELLRQMMGAWLRGAGPEDAAVVLCTIPAITCAAFAALELPVVHYSPTIITVQVPLQNIGPWLQLYAKMARDPKNHFIVNSEAYNAMHEAVTGQKWQVIPVLALYMNVTYTGHQSNRILVYDRSFTVLLQGLSALTPAEHMLHFIGHTQTDRQYTTFAEHRALIFVPTAVAQMAFWEFYAMGVPIFIPADASLYLWPPLPFGMVNGGVVTEDSGYARPGLPILGHGSYEHWEGVHHLNISVIAGRSTGVSIFVDLTLRRSNAVSVLMTAPGQQIAFDAEAVPLTTMDERGNTHSLEPSGEFGPVFGGRCVRLSNNLGLLSAWLGPRPGACPKLDAPGGCRAGPVLCKTSLWNEIPYRGEPPEGGAEQRDKPLDGAERSGFGESFWCLGRTVLTRRRRQRPWGDPSATSTHRSLRRLTHRLDMFQYPKVGRFISGAELLYKLQELEPNAVETVMHDFMKSQRSAGLALWRDAVLNAVVQHPSQEDLSTLV